MAKNDNRDDVGDYLSQVEQDNKKIQLHLGHPWYKGSRSNSKENIPSKNSLLIKIFLAIIFVLIGYIIYLASINFFIIWLIFCAVFGFMFYDASRKSKR